MGNLNGDGLTPSVHDDVFCSYYLNVNANTKRVKLSKEVGKQYFPVTDNQIEF